MQQTAKLATKVADEHPHSATRAQRLAVLVVCFFVFLVVYTLSAGPMVFLHDAFEFQQFQDSLELNYAPLIVIVENDIEPISTALRWYIGLFR